MNKLIKIFLLLPIILGVISKSSHSADEPQKKDELALNDNMHITNEALLRDYANITTLKVEGSVGIDDAGLSGLTNLRSLSIKENFNITQEGFKGLSQLITLNLVATLGVTSLKGMSCAHLEELGLSANNKLDCHSIDFSCFPNLKKLDVSENDKIGSKAESPLPSLDLLEVLNCEENQQITNEDILHCPNLRELNIKGASSITDAALQQLKKLCKLTIEMGSSRIPWDVLDQLEQKGVEINEEPQ